MQISTFGNIRRNMSYGQLLIIFSFRNQFAMNLLGRFQSVFKNTSETVKDSKSESTMTEGRSMRSVQMKTTLLELFTSQGCSSCPPADDLASVYDEKFNDILVLSFHVDYWDYLGWKDPHSSPSFTARQRKYSQIFRERSIYTPQVVINGEGGVVGSNRTAIQSLINKVNKTTNICMEVVDENGSLLIKGSGSVVDVVDVLLIKYHVEPTQNYVPRGENTGRTLTHIHVVKSVELVTTWNLQDEKIIQIPQSKVGLGYAIIVQSHAAGTIYATGVIA